MNDATAATIIIVAFIAGVCFMLWLITRDRP